MHSRVLILTSKISDEQLLADFDKAMPEVSARFGRHLVDKGARHPKEGQWQLDWVDPTAPSLEVTIFWNRDLRARYLEVKTESEQLKVAILADLEGRFPVITIRSLVDDAREAGAEEPLRYVHLGMAAADYDAECADVLRQGLKSSDPEVRFHAVKGIGFACWPEFRDDLSAALEAESDEGVARVIQFVASTLP
jgi:hypothetical protein